MRKQKIYKTSYTILFLAAVLLCFPLVGTFVAENNMLKYQLANARAVNDELADDYLEAIDVANQLQSNNTLLTGGLSYEEKKVENLSDNLDACHSAGS